MKKKWIIAGITFLAIVVTVMPFTATYAKEVAKPAYSTALRLPKEIKIGGILPLTGPVGAYGKLMSQGAKMAIDEINASGVIPGSVIKWMPEDFRNDPKVASEAFKKLVEVNGVQVVVGPTTSGGVMAVGQYAKARGILLISPSATSPLISDQPWTDIAFRTCPSDTFQGRALAKIILDKGFNKVAMMIRDDAYGVGIEKVAKEALKGKVGIVSDIKYDPKKLDYLTELRIIENKNPDCVLHVGFFDDSAVLYRQAMELGLDKIQWLSAEAVYRFPFKLSKQASEFMAKAVIGTALTSVGPRYDQFCTNYKARFGVDPCPFTDLTYDATSLVAKAIKKAGICSGLKIRDALKDVGKKYQGATGTITFDNRGDRISATYQVWKVEKTAEGKYRFSKTGIIAFE